MANVYFLNEALGFSEKPVRGKNELQILDIDEIVTRAVSGHDLAERFHYRGFDIQYSTNPTRYYTNNSRFYANFLTQICDGKIAAGDRFVIGIIPQYLKVKSIAAQQLNTVDGLQITFKLMDGIAFTDVAGTDTLLDFSNDQVTDSCSKCNRWEADNTVITDTSTGLNPTSFNLSHQVQYVVAELTAVPLEWTDGSLCPADCTANGGCANLCIPYFQLSIIYDDACLPHFDSSCAPVPTYDAYVAGWDAYKLANEVYIWNEIRGDISKFG